MALGMVVAPVALIYTLGKVFHAAFGEVPIWLRILLAVVGLLVLYVSPRLLYPRIFNVVARRMQVACLQHLAREHDDSNDG